jgi:hypothetical protein
MISAATAHMSSRIASMVATALSTGIFMSARMSSGVRATSGGGSDPCGVPRRTIALARRSPPKPISCASRKLR